MYGTRPYIKVPRDISPRISLCVGIKGNGTADKTERESVARITARTQLFSDLEATLICLEKRRLAQITHRKGEREKQIGFL